ncbi:MAG: DUF167 domain-containing protein [Chloroflexi bacterium]|nr:DUF167 domain-containing protein [Chloroflexota bacterium]
MPIQIRVQPKAGRERVEVVDGPGPPKLKVYVTAAPEGGKANAAVVALLADRLGVAKGAVQIVRGHRSRDKSVEIEGVTPSQAVRILSEDI